MSESSPEEGRPSSSSQRRQAAQNAQPPQGREMQPLLSDDQSAHIVQMRRGPTDILFLLLFGVYWIALLALSFYAFTQDSSTNYAEYVKDQGVDFKGHECGSSRFLYFPDFQRNPDFGICIDDCPRQDGQDLVFQLPLEDDNSMATEDSTSNATRHLTEVHFKSYKTHPWTYVCAPVEIDSESVMVAKLQDNIGRFIGALSEAWQSLFIGCGIAVGTATIYLIMLRYCGCLTIGVSILGIESILVYASYRMLAASSDPLVYPNDPAMKSSLQLTAVVCCCSAILFFIFALMMLPRFLLAGTFISHAAAAQSKLKKLLVVPFLSFLLLLVIFWWGILVTVHLFGAGQMSERVATIDAASPSTIQITTQSFEPDTRLRWLFLFHAWGMYWTATFVLSIGEMIVSIAVALWYFGVNNRGDSTHTHESYPDPVNFAAHVTMRYHLGTVALSSATIAPVSTIRGFFLYLQEKNEVDNNAVTNFLTKGCCCCIWCFNSCLKFVCNEAMYITAIRGSNFYSSGKLAYTLVSSNLLRMGALSVIGNASVLLGKMIVCTTTCLIAWFLLNDVGSPLLPLLAMGIFSYGVAHGFMTIYETSINMLLLCFTLDENMHGGRGRAEYTPAPLLRSVNDHLRPKWQTSL